MLDVPRAGNVKGVYIPPAEMREVISLVGEASYALYYVLRTYPFKEAEEITDDYLAVLTGWKASKVKRVRLRLKANNLYLTIRYGTKAKGVTKMFVGLEPIALHNAGLPADIINTKAHIALKNKFNINSTEELIAKADMIVREYTNNPDLYGSK